MPTAPPTDEVMHIVRRFNWRDAGPCFVRAPGEHRVARFGTADDAAADARRREVEVRGRLNPFRCGPAFHYLSAMPELVFRDWLMDDGIDPPPSAPTLAAWADWWDAAKAGLSDPQRHRVWDGLNRVRFHDVIARRPSEVAYAVVRLMWDYNDAWYEAGNEGGEAVVAFRSRERAEERCWELEARARSDVELHSIDPRRWDDGNWPTEAESVGWHLPAQDIRYYEVIEIDVN